jgi:hypothetical protein
MNGTKFNKYTEKSLFPLPFMIYFAKKEDAEIFFNDFINSCKYKDRIKKLYETLPYEKNMDLNYHEFMYAGIVKLAFVNGLKII